MTRPLISLTTDFGLADSYVAIMKGVILDICREASLVDISHQVRPQAVQQASFLLSTAIPFFPVGTVHLVVVDPGVGSPRRPIAVQTDRAIYVAPDNGVLSMALRQDPARQAVHIRTGQSRYVLPQISATFHGRDVFAPVAAHLACGIELCELGNPIPPSTLVSLPIPEPQLQGDGTWLAEILHVDRAGNLITNCRLPDSSPHISSENSVGQAFQPVLFHPSWHPAGHGISILISETRISRLSRTFSDVEPGQPLAYVGSSGYLEIAIREGNAAAQLGVDVGDSIRIEDPGS